MVQGNKQATILWKRNSHGWLLLLQVTAKPAPLQRALSGLATKTLHVVVYHITLLFPSQYILHPET